MGGVARVVNDRYGYKPEKAGEPPQELGDELADVQLTICALANSLGIDLDASFAAVLEKYRRRDSGRYVTPDASPYGKRSQRLTWH